MTLPAFKTSLRIRLDPVHTPFLDRLLKDVSGQYGSDVTLTEVRREVQALKEAANARA